MANSHHYIFFSTSEISATNLEDQKVPLLCLNSEHHFVVILKGIWLLNCLFRDIK